MKNHRIIASGARKGGVGKTALAREFGARLARTHRVALVNADSQDTLTMALGMQAEPGLSKLLTSDALAEDWLREVPRSVWAPPDGSAKGELYVLPGDESTAAAGVDLILKQTPLFLLRERLAALIDDDIVDYIILDTSPSIMPFSPWMYAAADAAFIPTGGALEGINGIVQTEKGFEVIAEATQGAHEIEVIGVVPTQILPRTNLHRKNWSVMQRKWRGKVWPMIQYRITWQYATQFGQALTAHAPGSEADLEAEQAFEVFCEMIGLEDLVGVSHG